ncbi:COP9 signalosome complex subunit 4 isoform X2 [Capsella rubella]|uniref:COP9 signalosome complex subunit 4 isoform X2 n=1 Tax=Capsella rubella TaxID=81985 RepID=UPI000CD4E1C0|nr:COP9 signalosome complex subunit 4 isoform X2 [Capsella rubella]
MDEALTNAAAISDQRQKIEQYKLILSSVLSSNDLLQAQRLIDHILFGDVPLVVSRQLLQSFAQELGRLEPETQKEISQFTLTQIQPRVVSFEEHVCFLFRMHIYKYLIALAIREKLAGLYESEQEWSKAAQMLSCIDLGSGMRAVDENFKFSKCIQILMLQDAGTKILMKMIICFSRITTSKLKRCSWERRRHGRFYCR